MLNKKILWSSLSVLIALQVYTAQAFDLEDYATTYRATRDAYLKALNELKLATSPYKSAQKSYYIAQKTYSSGLNEGSPAVVKAKVTVTNNKCGIIYNDSDAYDPCQPQPDNNNFPSISTIDYERCTRKAYLKASGELISAAYKLKSTEDAYKQASYTYIKSTEIHDRYIFLKSKLLEQK